MSGYSDEDLKKILRAAVREELASQAPQQPGESHADHVAGCPECLSGAMEKLNKTSDYVCEGCGFPLGDETFMKKLKSCPNCGKTKPMKRR